MLESTLSPDSAMPTLLLMHWRLYKLKPTKWCVCVAKWSEGRIYRVPGSVPPPWKR
jgi:uncharacterized protein (DUF2237 family)